MYGPDSTPWIWIRFFAATIMPRMAVSSSNMELYHAVCCTVPVWLQTSLRVNPFKHTGCLARECLFGWVRQSNVDNVTLDLEGRSKSYAVCRVLLFCVTREPRHSLVTRTILCVTCFNIKRLQFLPHIFMFVMIPGILVNTNYSA
jgi:hypothetical protein